MGDADDTLPQRLKAATRELHARAERSGVMAGLLAGTVERAGYIALLANLRAIYEALEAGLDARHGLAALARTAAIDADLRAFGATAPTLAPAALDYVARLRTLHGAQAHRLWAHVYVRCLGDLHGGQILGRLVRKRFAVADATHFHDFGDDARVRALRAALRSQLASLPLTPMQTDDVVAEAVWAFEAHCRLFEEIAATR